MPLYEPPEHPPGAPEYVTLNRGLGLFRIHSAAYGATQFNDRVANNPFQGGRFDSATGDYSYLYAGRRLNGAVVETLLRDVPTLSVGSRVLPLAQLHVSCRV